MNICIYKMACVVCNFWQNGHVVQLLVHRESFDFGCKIVNTVGYGHRVDGSWCEACMTVAIIQFAGYQKCAMSGEVACKPIGFWRWDGAKNKIQFEHAHEWKMMLCLVVMFPVGRHGPECAYHQKQTNVFARRDHCVYFDSFVLTNDGGFYFVPTEMPTQNTMWWINFE